MSGSSMRSGPAAHDPEFRGIDPAALGHLVKQVQDANRAIQSWLSSHPVPAGVSATGYRQANDVTVWISEQIGMLTRRHNYALTHPDAGGGVTPPAKPRRPTVPKGPSGGGGGGVRPTRPPRQPRTPRTVPRGADQHLGNFPSQQAAEKAARSDASTVRNALKEHKPIPGEVWKRLKANAEDPDYTKAFYERLGPQGTADLIKQAQGDEARLALIRRSLGMSSFHLRIDVVWLKALLAEAERNGNRAEVLQILTHAEMSRRTHDALVKLGLLGDDQGEPETEPRTPVGAP